MTENSVPVLSVQNLRVSFDTQDGTVHAVDGVSFDAYAGETICIVGESGSGKSVMASSIMRLNNSSTATTEGRILVKGLDVLSASEEEVRGIRGSEVAMIFQDPMSALNPYFTVGKQIAEAYVVHHPGASKHEIHDVVLAMMIKVGIPSPEKRIDEYPHQFSGGMRQRIVIAIALINNPKILIADEPTTALDVTVQAQILDLMMSLQKEFGMTIILITHDLGVVAEVAQDVIVMYAGHIVEQSHVDALFHAPTHPYSWGLLGSVASYGDNKRGGLLTISGSPPSLISLPVGCSFHPRCAHSKGEGSVCMTDSPSLRSVGSDGSRSACHLADDVLVSVGRRGFRS
ncbi:MAG: ABC transporter ATP-binding protein [Actinobacteria bacterium]|nr:ABC transporter ATP-binding protein [Actinomycetota bacterium]